MLPLVVTIDCPILSSSNPSISAAVVLDDAHKIRITFESRRHLLLKRSTGIYIRGLNDFISVFGVYRVGRGREEKFLERKRCVIIPEMEGYIKKRVAEVPNLFQDSQCGRYVNQEEGTFRAVVLIYFRSDFQSILPFGIEI